MKDIEVSFECEYGRVYWIQMRRILSFKVPLVNIGFESRTRGRRKIGRLWLGENRDLMETEQTTLSRKTYTEGWNMEEGERDGDITKTGLGNISAGAYNDLVD